MTIKIFQFLLNRSVDIIMDYFIHGLCMCICVFFLFFFLLFFFFFCGWWGVGRLERILSAGQTIIKLQSILFAHPPVTFAPPPPTFQTRHVFYLYTHHHNCCNHCNYCCYNPTPSHASPPSNFSNPHPQHTHTHTRLVS